MGAKTCDDNNKLMVTSVETDTGSKLLVRYCIVGTV